MAGFEIIVALLILAFLWTQQPVFSASFRQRCIGTVRAATLAVPIVLGVSQPLYRRHVVASLKALRSVFE